MDCMEAEEGQKRKEQWKKRMVGERERETNRRMNREGRRRVQKLIERTTEIAIETRGGLRVKEGKDEQIACMLC